MICFRRLFGRHNSSKLERFITYELQRLYITNKIVSITTDNCADTKKATRNKFGIRISCFAHILHLTVKNGLKLWINKSAKKSKISKTSVTEEQEDSDDDFNFISNGDIDSDLEEDENDENEQDDDQESDSDRASDDEDFEELTRLENTQQENYTNDSSDKLLEDCYMLVKKVRTVIKTSKECDAKRA